MKEKPRDLPNNVEQTLSTVQSETKNPLPAEPSRVQVLINFYREFPGEIEHVEP